jgi:hypothetical protein
MHMESGYYWNTSEAFKLPPETPVPRKARLKRRRVRTRPVFIYAPSATPQVKMAPILTLVLVFAGALAMSLCISSYYMAASSVSSLQSKLASQRETNANLAKLASEDPDLDLVRETAKGLGMSEPKPYQEFKISVPKGSYAVASGPVEEEPIEEQAATGIFSWFK